MIPTPPLFKEQENMGISVGVPGGQLAKAVPYLAVTAIVASAVLWVIAVL